MGRFVCRNRSCTKDGWGSKKIAITIRMYAGASYNARVYSQRCKHCDVASSPTLDDSCPDRVAYRIKKWCGIELDRPQGAQGRGPPHEKSLCEGCQAGHCAAGRSGVLFSTLNHLTAN
ncbi:hypothetical protein G6O67_006635 [Ophiocordyceps sinensis]|uniref:3CxxC-type domain-containing protein n=1 Tax=Ophiocordyceps sinensis TaxID=72228 RepID=A0A8H4LVY8_9HYPO|nr:hypothetical protein G6O67_006635 [Ophiocordyceps sinensis]